MGVIIFNGKSSKDFGIIVEQYPSINRGAKRGEAYQIPGRNGTFYSEDGTYDNYVQAYNVAIIEKNRGAAARCADIAAWLSVPGFARLEDSFEPEYFKLARFAGPLNIDQIMGRYGRCTLEFECQPERWLKSGDEEIQLTDGTIYNPTGNVAKPIIRIVRSATTVLSVNNDAFMSIGGYSSGNTNVYIDCENGTIIDGQGNDLYGSTVFYKNFQDFPVLEPGTSTIAATNSTLVYVTPRWWVL